MSFFEATKTQSNEADSAACVKTHAVCRLGNAQVLLTLRIGFVDPVNRPTSQA
eukprot:m.919864 g.919864  ORF g.919864 m.919864 type:complete len:53 (+) comp60326_c0_seq1:3247-3405(+)